MGLAISENPGQLGYKTASTLSFIEIVFALMMAWLLVNLWQKVIENLAYRTLGLNENSTYHAFIVAGAATVIFIAYVLSVNTVLGGIVEPDIEGSLQQTAALPSSRANTIARESSVKGVVKGVVKGIVKGAVKGPSDPLEEFMKSYTERTEKNEKNEKNVISLPVLNHLNHPNHL